MKANQALQDDVIRTNNLVADRDAAHLVLSARYGNLRQEYEVSSSLVKTLEDQVATLQQQFQFLRCTGQSEPAEGLSTPTDSVNFLSTEEHQEGFGNFSSQHGVMSHQWYQRGHHSPSYYAM